MFCQVFWNCIAPRYAEHNLSKGMQLQNISQHITLTAKVEDMLWHTYNTTVSYMSQLQVMPASLPGRIHYACQAEPQVFVCPACNSVKGKDISNVTRHFQRKPDCLRNTVRVGTQHCSPALILTKSITVQLMQLICST